MGNGALTIFTDKYGNINFIMKITYLRLLGYSNVLFLYGDSVENIKK